MNKSLLVVLLAVSAVVDEAKIIRRISMDGNRGGCFGVARRVGEIN